RNCGTVAHWQTISNDMSDEYYLRSENNIGPHCIRQSRLKCRNTANCKRNRMPREGGVDLPGSRNAVFRCRTCAASARAWRCRYPEPGRPLQGTHLCERCAGCAL